MATLGAETWFNLGDRDLATHLYRTGRLRSGVPLSAVTAEVARSLGVAVRLLPMSDDPVRTRVRTADGWLGFQEYFVREKALVDVQDIVYAGAEVACPAPGVCEALTGADLIVVCPSNPLTSVGPILAVPGMVAALAAARAAVVAVSPIVGSAAVSGPAGALMRARGLPVSPAGVARAYAPWLDALLIDTRDQDRGGAVSAEGARPITAEIIMTDKAAEVALARRVLEAVAR
jgi:LPPG:FO 2-phospho-L-lactate transferase